MSLPIEDAAPSPAPRHVGDAGEAGSLAALVARYEPEILRLAARLTGDPDAARDVLQQTLVRAHAGRAGFEGRARLSTWLHRVVVNLCRDKRRADDARERALRGAAAEREEASEATPVRAAIADETAQRVARAVRALPAGEREVVVLRHYAGLSFPEIARVLDAPATTIKSRMARGLLRLRDRLQDLET